MKNLKRALLLIMMVLPLSAFAHGEEVLLIIFAQVIAFIILLIVLFFMKFEPAGKLILFLAYIATIFITFYFFDFKYGEFLRNKYNISAGMVLPPVVITVMTYILLKSKYGIVN